ncbi:MAG: hypothetical protein EX262_05600 [Sphingomonadaceae bacterium]|nr:MAG: hypothetical protein EX262_05600 [Sphingomonadaceae bacterium]
MISNLIRLCAFGLLVSAIPAQARDSLGIFEEWGAFRDPQTPRCYAVAKPSPSSRSRDYAPFAAIGTWPQRNVRGQVHFRLSREIANDRTIRLVIGDRVFELTGGGGDAWARDRAMDAAIVAAMRSGTRMVISASDKRGRRFSDRYNLSGAATAMDAATIGCARR